MRPFTALAMLTGLLAAVPVIGASAQSSAATPLPACAIGAYRSAGGDVAVIMTAEGRYRLLDGRRGAAAGADTPVRCGKGEVWVRGADGLEQRFRFLPLKFTPTRFRSGAITLSGLLIEPEAKDRKGALVVLGHGSEKSGTVGLSHYPYMFAAQGISAFVYDKRGTGTSEGRFSSNFRVLAADMTAASAEARRLAAGRFSRFGLWGGSQAGWVIPMAAKGAGAQFMVIAFGGVFTPIEEDSEGVQDLLKEAGYGEEVLAKARRLTELTTAIVLSRGERGYEAFARFRAAHAHEDWFRNLKPDDYSGAVMNTPEADLRRQLAVIDEEADIDMRHDPMPVLRALDLPTLWILAGKDRESPGRLTQDRLALLQAEGEPIDVVTFPDTDHGIYEFVQAPDGSRKMTRNADGYYRLLGDWINGRLSPPYGRAQFQPASAETTPAISRRP